MTKIKTTKQKKQLKQTDYAQVICDHFNASKPILSNKNNELMLQDDEIFLPCWADIPTRRTFPKYWYISQYDNLISAWNNKVKWIEPHERPDGNKCYKYIIKFENEAHLKTVETHNLLGLVFGSEAYGRAKELLKQDGVYAFGIKQKGIIRVNGHHKDGNHNNNTPDNIQFITTPVHILLDKIPSHNATDEDIFRFMIDLSKLAEQEEPNKATIILTGDTYSKKTGEYIGNDGNISIHALNSITLSKEALMQVLGVMYAE